MKVRQIINIVVGLFRETEVKPILIVITKVNRLFNVYSSPSEARSAELSEFTISSREKRAQYVDPSKLQSRSAYLYLTISRALKRSYALSGSAVMRSTTGTSSLFHSRSAVRARKMAPSSWRQVRIYFFISLDRCNL